MKALPVMTEVGAKAPTVRYATSNAMTRRPSRPGYEYILAGNGIFKRGASDLLDVCIKLAHCRIPSLPPMQEYVILRHGPLPIQFLHALLEDARRVAWAAPKEAMYHVLYRHGQYELVKPRQDPSGGIVRYNGGGSPLIVADVHSHIHMSARFSQTDDGDETGFRLYFVIGRIYDAMPEVRGRLGVYGHFHPVEMTHMWDRFYHVAFVDMEQIRSERTIRWPGSSR